MPRPNHRKRTFLFLAAVLLPSAVLVGTTLFLIRQERELAVRRAGEERALLALQVGQDLLEDLRQLGDRVERIPLTAESVYGLSDSNPALLTVATLRRGILAFPWEVASGFSPIPDQEASRRHGDLLARGMEAEHRAGDFARAAELYQQAAEVGNIAPKQVAEARVGQARSLLRAGGRESARVVFELLSRTPSYLVDTEEMPYFLYGLDGLRRTGAGHGDLTDLLEESRDEVGRFSLTALVAWRSLAEEIVASGAEGSATSEEESADLALLSTIHEAADRRAVVVETLDGLRHDISGLMAGASGERSSEDDRSGPLWLPYGEEPWLVGILPGPSDPRSRVAVVSPPALLEPTEEPGSPRWGAASIETGPDGASPARSVMALLPAGEPGGESLGPALNGLRGEFPPGYPPPHLIGGVEGWFFRLLLPIILLLTAFTAYLAWRDVRRETEAVRLRSQFVSSVTHELKTPLTSIRMFAETLRLGRHAGPEAQQEYLDTVVHETERLSRLINNVLDFARIDRGEKTYQMAPTDVGAAVREAARAVAYPLAQGGLTLTSEIADDLPLVLADSDSLTQAVLNLLSNAIKFSGQEGEIGLKVSRQGEDLLLQVEDGGRGIAPEDQAAIFEDFYRTADAEEDGIPGTGLGLSLVAHVARAHGGNVAVESEVGRGSTFTIRIPLSGEPSGQRPGGAP